jgi:putative transposase
LLPNGIAGTLSIRIPETINIQGDLAEVRLKFGYVLITYKIDDEVRQQNTIIGVDLGVNTLIAATDGEKAILVSGREAKATVQWRNKKLASLQTKQAKKIKGSIRYKRIQNRKQKLLTKSKNRMNDIIHKATRKVANEFPSAKAFVGKPFNGAAQKMAPKQAQQVSSACNAKIIRQLDYKLFGAIEVNEAYTSQTCPVCGARQKVGRIYKCCNFAVPRDIIGSINILSIGLNGVIASGRDTPNTIKCVYPMKNILKYPVPPQVVPEDVGQVVQNI